MFSAQPVVVQIEHAKLVADDILQHRAEGSWWRRRSRARPPADRLMTLA